MNTKFKQLLSIGDNIAEKSAMFRKIAIFPGRRSETLLAGGNRGDKADFLSFLSFVFFSVGEGKKRA